MELAVRLPIWGPLEKKADKSSLDPAQGELQRAGSPKCLNIEPCFEENNLGSEQRMPPRSCGNISESINHCMVQISYY